MNTSEHGCHHSPRWEHFGHAAERFARRVAEDAKLFAERVEEHVGDFARDMRREWRQTESTDSAEDIRRIFDEVRGVVRSVLDGVDELVSGLFNRDSGQESSKDWSKVVLNRDATCAGCSRDLTAGAEAWVRHTAGGAQFRCGDCGAPRA
jgi:hypothetical protein